MTKNIVVIVIYTLLFQFFSNNLNAVEPDEILKDKRQEIRARSISKNIRCVVCQNQSIDESNASLAKDLRILIRKQIKNGKKDEEIYKFLTDRYGDFILLQPRLKKNTMLLWFLPFIFLLVGIFIVFYHNRKSKKI